MATKNEMMTPAQKEININAGINVQDMAHTSMEILRESLSTVPEKTDAELYAQPEVVEEDPEEEEVIPAKTYSVANPQPTSENFSEGTYYTKDDDDNYSVASSFVEDTTYYVEDTQAPQE